MSVKESLTSADALIRRRRCLVVRIRVGIWFLFQ
jgi:hypothetical protein